ncbi:hypothetical protein [Sphingobacterium sp.]|uniref:hypothetical protein n=1 Tax=Sphingobacterium sp. TaxID=341027 RepID=UPI0028A9F906|nr:hypothetical protein [Sphingobacterium sp.]
MAKNNAKGASKKAQMNSMIDNMVANAGIDKGAFRFNMSILEQVVAEFIEWVKTDINAIKDHMVTGSIQELSLRVNNLNEVEVLGLEHLIYQSRGVSGTQTQHNTPHRFTTLKPPVAPIIEWVKERQLLTKNASKFYDNVAFDGYDEDRQIQQLAFAIREQIYKHGYKGKNYWDKNVDRLRQELNTRVQANLGDQLRFFIYNQYGDNVHNKK